MKKLLAVSTVAVAMAAAPAFAQTSHPKSSTPTTAKQTASKQGAQASDQKFVMEAAKGGMAEVELGKLAQDKASSDQVKNFGKRMVDDHSKANDELQTLAKNKNITLPSDLDPKDKALKDRLSKLSGAQFDRAYMSAMLRDHQKDVSEFKMESSNGKDPDVKAFASKTLPTLEDHLKLAQQTEKAVGTSGTAKSSKKVGTGGVRK
jgi:putative membrane protein